MRKYKFTTKIEDSSLKKRAQLALSSHSICKDDSIRVSDFDFMNTLKSISNRVKLAFSGDFVDKAKEKGYALDTATKMIYFIPGEANDKVASLINDLASTIGFKFNVKVIKEFLSSLSKEDQYSEQVLAVKFNQQAILQLAPQIMKIFLKIGVPDEKLLEK